MNEEIIKYLVSFLFGAFSGAVATYFGTYFGNKYTDKRRTKETKKEEKNTFKKVSRIMPELLIEMKKDLSDESFVLVREFFLCNKKNTVNSSSPRFRYHFDEHANLQNKIDVLENHGYIFDVTLGNTPIYRMTEEFVALLKEHEI